MTSASDSEPSHDEDVQPGKPYKRLRRLRGACDVCKKKKTRCDSAVMPNKICTNCINAKLECTRTIQPQKKRDKQQEYILLLEHKIRLMEERLSSAPSEAASSPSNRDETGNCHECHTISIDRPPLIPQVLNKPSPESIKEEQVDSDVELMEGKLGRMSIGFFGRSSLLSFASQAAEAKDEYSGLPEASFAKLKRHPLWNLRPWEEEYANIPDPTYVYPDLDLLEILLRQYREWVHPQLPVLHWPSFVRDVRGGRHFREPEFGRVLLSVCAIASRYTDDERIMIQDHRNPELAGSSAGWSFIAQTPLIRHAIMSRATLMDLQYYVLAVYYFLGSSSPQLAWNLLGLAVRIAIEKGMHRRRGFVTKPQAHVELEKRVFWCLLTLEWLTSASVGRPSCLHEEDIDLDYPLEVDDEYWESEVYDQSQAFQQPANKPSMLTTAIHHLKLCEIAAFMHRTLYSTRKSKLLTGSIGEQWERRIVAEIDSALNKWKDGLPLHLRWDPNTPSSADFKDQVLIHSAFYYLQIQLHRQFLKSKSTLSLSSLAMCANAARACSHLVEVTLRRNRFYPINLITAAFAASTVLVIKLWSRNIKISYDPQAETTNIQNIINFLRMAGKRWHLASRFADMVTEFCSLGDVPMPVPEASSSRKRSRSYESTADWPSNPAPATEPSALPWMGHSHYILPLVPTDTSPSPIPSNSALLPSSNPDWDLSTLLLAQLGYNEIQEASSSMNHGLVESAQPNGFGFGDSSVLSDYNASTMSMWKSVPTAYSIEEWDTYLASLSNQ